MATSKNNLLDQANLSEYIPGKDEAYMSSSQVEHFRAILTIWLKQLQDEAERTVHHLQDEASKFADEVDRASQEEEFNLELRNRDRERRLIKKIEKTLVKLESKDFGFCDSCGVEIGLKRLEARPTADFCIDCKTIAEIKEKQMRGN